MTGTDETNLTITYLLQTRIADPLDLLPGQRLPQRFLLPWKSQTQMARPRFWRNHDDRCAATQSASAQVRIQQEV